MKYKLIASLLVVSSVMALNQDSSPKEAVGVDDTPREPARSSAQLGDSDLAEALNLAKSNRYTEASVRLFQLSYSPRFLDKRMQIKYVLGLTLQKMNLPQLAAFQFMSVVKDGNSHYAGQALEKLSQVADILNDESLLNYAYSKIKIDNFPHSQRDRLYLRIGEFERRHSQFEQSAETFGRVQPGSPYYASAKYQQGLAFAEGNKVDRSVAAFDELVESRRRAAPNDNLRAAGLMGKARALYQKKDWDAAIAAYREVPRDTFPWHDTLFESSWAMVRSGRFRSALSNFHSLHSAFYENTYLPESLILRSIVYLYICKYDETEKVLNLFSRMYKPAYQNLDASLRSSTNPAEYFNMIHKIMVDYQKDPEGVPHRNNPIPFVVAEKVSHEADFRKSYSYVKQLVGERRRMDALPAGWRASTLGQYSRKVIETRLAKAKIHAGRQVRSHLIAVHNELLDLIEQGEFIRYEILNGRKEELKKRIAGKELPATQVDADNERDYYVQNGFEYWPFRGEYWLDELGNYHYVGTQSCH
jgi:tetratricopeptide (TPR) repeat protein